mgnify:CR=1 FL=1
MSIKTGVKYNLSNMKKSIMVIYAIMLGMILVVDVVGRIAFGNASGRTSYDSTFWIMFFVVGIATYVPNLKMFLQNGVSRKTYFVCTCIEFVIASMSVALIDSVIGMLGRTDVYRIETFFGGTYGARIENTVFFLIMNILFNFVVNLLCAAGGLFVGTAFYKMGKKLGLFIGILLFILCFIVFPLADINLFSGAMTMNIGKFLLFITGVTNGFNPVYPVVSFLIISGISLALSYLLIRRINIRET